MQPEYEKPCMVRPDFSKLHKPTYDYRNMEHAGQFQGVGEAGKTASFTGNGGIDAMPPKQRCVKVPRDHRG
jgi:hypothetical protein